MDSEYNGLSSPSSCRQIGVAELAVAEVATLQDCVAEVARLQEMDATEPEFWRIPLPKRRYQYGPHPTAHTPRQADQEPPLPKVRLDVAPVRQAVQALLGASVVGA